MFSINKNNENNIKDYIAYVISNLSNGYIHLYWTIGVIIFGLIRFFIKNKVTKPFFFKKKLKLVKTDWFRFGYFRKTNLFFLAQFFGLAWFFSGLDRVFFYLARVLFSLGLVWFNFFGFRLIKPKPNQTG